MTIPKVFFASLFALSACQVGNNLGTNTLPSGTEQTEQSVSVSFAAKVNGNDFSCESSFEDIGVMKSTIRPKDFRFYIHNLVAINMQGQSVPVELDADGKWQTKSLALLDFEDASGSCTGNSDTRMKITGKLPAGQYKGLRFVMGVPFEQNHQDMNQAESPLNLTSLFWNWRGGYKFARLDVASGDASFNIHLGSTGCTGGEREGPSGVPLACANPNLVQVELPDFEMGKHQVIADLGSLLKNSDISKNAEDTPPGCMSGPDDNDCQPIFQQLGLMSDSESGVQSFLQQAEK